MLEFLSDYGLFLAKTVTLAAAILAIVIGSIGAAVRARRQAGGERLEIHSINEHLEELRDAMNEHLLDPAARKLWLKKRKQELKARRKGKTKPEGPRSRVFVLDFDGDLQASAVSSLREEISAILQVADKDDEVLLKLESGGGMVHSYGLAASQLTRITGHGLRLTVAVDKVAASGGYLMACVAQQILSAPFAIIGSIGVVAQLPNFHRLLKKHDVDFELHTAGDYKRTLTVFGENTDAARAKFREELEETHELFKRFVIEHRPSVDLATVATGEHWYGSQAVTLRLVDRLSTSDDYLLERAGQADVFALRYRHKRPISERLAAGLARLSNTLRGRLASSAPPVA